MRKRFEIQYELGTTPVDEIEITTKSRDELPPTLRALQYIYVTPSLNSAVFELMERHLGKSTFGRPGMSYWEILVLGVVRLTLDCNYDRLEDTANNHKLIRDLLGVSTFEPNPKQYQLQTLKDNISIFTEELLDQINMLVVKAGHKLKKKRRIAGKNR